MCYTEVGRRKVEPMNLIKKIILFLAVGVSSSYSFSTLKIVNNTVGLLKAAITRQGKEVSIAKADPNKEFKQDDLLESGDQIDFKPAGDSSGPVLPSVVVVTKSGKAANVTIICTPDGCNVEQF